MDYLFRNIYKYITEERGKIARDTRRRLGNPRGFGDAEKTEKTLDCYARFSFKQKWI